MLVLLQPNISAVGLRNGLGTMNMQNVLHDTPVSHHRIFDLLSPLPRTWQEICLGSAAVNVSSSVLNDSEKIALCREVRGCHIESSVEEVSSTNAFPTLRLSRVFIFKNKSYRSLICVTNFELCLEYVI
jgi:hypothetical protein